MQNVPGAAVSLLVRGPCLRGLPGFKSSDLVSMLPADSVVLLIPWGAVGG